MKKLIPFLILAGLLFTQGAQAVVSAGVSAAATTGATFATTLSTTGVTTQASGSAFYVDVVIDYFGASPQTPNLPTDNKGNTYVHIGTQLVDGSGRTVDRYYCQGGTGGTGHTITSTVPTSALYTIAFIEIKGAASSGLLDTGGSNSNVGFVGSPYSSGSVTISPPATYGEMMISVFSTEYNNASITFAEANGFTIQQTQVVGNANYPAIAVGTKVVTSNGTYSASWTDGNGASQIAIAIDSFLGGTGGSSCSSTGYSTTNGGGAVPTSGSGHFWQLGGTNSSVNCSSNPFYKLSNGSFVTN